MEIKTLESTTTAPGLLGWLIAVHLSCSTFVKYLQRIFRRTAEWHIFQPLGASAKDGEHCLIARRLRFVIFGKRQIRASLLVQSEQVPQVVVDRQAMRGGLGANGLQNFRRDLFV